MKRSLPDTMETDHWPTEIRHKTSDRVLEIDFDTGERYALPAELLRVESPSAEVQGHNPSQKQIIAGKRSVAIKALEPVGNYAVRIVFDDGHDTGLFSWKYLFELGQRQNVVWRDYLEALKQRGLSRDHG
ncbi:MAG: DUF971 domain-containing protein [Pseudomonadota bacterium]